MKLKLNDSDILWNSIKVFFTVKKSVVYLLSIVFGVTIAKLVRVLNFNNDIKIDGQSTREIIAKAAFLIVVNDLIELAGYRITDYLTDVCFIKQQSQVGVLAFRTILTDSSMDLDLKSGKIQYFIRQGGIGIAKVVKNVIFLTFSEIIEMVFTFCFLGFADKSSSVLLLILSFCSILIVLTHLKVTEYKIRCKRLSNLALVECDKALYELLINYDIIKSNSMENEETKKYYNKLKMYERAYIKYGWIEDILDFVHGCSFILTKGMLMVYIFKNTTEHVILAPSIRRLMKSTKNIDTISSKTGTIYRKIKEGLLNARMAFDYIYEYENLESLNEEKIDSFKRSIVFNQVDIFAKKVKILTNLNFEIKKGEKLAFIGKNGRGKSTIFKTLLKLQRFAGRIEIDGSSILNFSDYSYKNLFSYMPQNNFLFDDTIKNNILYGVKTKVTDDYLHFVCEQVKLHDSVMSLAEKYDTVVGERGENLSGGQRQKILIARALLRNTQIFLFDEPLNNLDKESIESFISTVFGDTFSDKTVVMIIHAYEYLHLFDKVIDIDENSVIKKY